MKKIEYGTWSPHPEIIDLSEVVPAAAATWRKLDTKHEGEILYEKYWNFWIRAGVKGDSRSDLFFRDYQKSNKKTDHLLNAIGVPSSYPANEIVIWDRISSIWNWLASNIQLNPAAYGTISSQPNAWPSFLDYAKYFAAHGSLAWAACFSKAHVFASLIGRVIPITRRILLAKAHHTEGNAPPTATHVYVGVYVSDQWFYLDPAAVPFTQFPSFDSRRSIGVAAFISVDYEHPYGAIMLPCSELEYVPYLST